MKILNKSMTLSIIALSTVSILLAQDIPMNGPMPFSVIDKNNDGIVSESEFYDMRAAKMTKKAEQGKLMKNAGNAPSFTDFDTNNDGKLSKSELKAAQKKMMKRKLENRASSPRYNQQP